MDTNQKINKLRELMRENGISFYIIPSSDPHGSEYLDEHYKDRAYMSGFTGSAGTLVVSENEAALFVDGRYHLQADSQTQGSCINVYKLGVKGVPTMLHYLSEKVTESDVLAFDGRIMMYSELKLLQSKLKCNFHIEDDLIEQIYERPEITSNSVFSLPIDISGEEVRSKLLKVTDYLKAKKADGIVISALDDICYLFNFRGSDIKYSTVAFSYACITADSATLYLMKNTYDKSFEEELDAQGVHIADYEDFEQELFKIKGKRILIDEDYTSAYFAKILNLGNEVINDNNFKIIKKHIKNETEIKLARKYAVSDAVAMIEYIVSLKSSILDGFDVDEYFAKEYLTTFRSNMKGFYCLSFESIVGYRENGAIVHYSVPKKGSKKLENGGFLLVDSGSHYMGATTDITRTIALGELTDEERAAYTVVLKGNLKLMDAVFLKGTRCENLDILARESLWKLGLDYRHGTGHGIGAFLNVHEGPIRIGYKILEDMPQPELAPGMIVSDEPGYYADGKFGIRHETQLLCVEKYETEYGMFYGFEPLSLVPFEKDAICFELLTAEEFDILKRYSDLIREKVMGYLSEDGKKWLEYNTNFVD